METARQNTFWSQDLERLLTAWEQNPEHADKDMLLKMAVALRNRNWELWKLINELTKPKS